MNKPSRYNQLLVAQLNDKWRVVDDGLQWILESRRGKSWRPMSYCTQRDVIFRCYREDSARQKAAPEEITAAGRAAVEALPEKYDYG